MKKILKKIIKIMYKTLRFVYRLLPLPRALKNRIRCLAGRAADRLQQSLGYERPEVLQRFYDYEETIRRQSQAIDDCNNIVNIYKKYTSEILQSRNCLKVINKGSYNRPACSPRIAIQVHIFYTELFDEIINNLKMIPYKFDCFITTDTDEKAAHIADEFGKQTVQNISNICIERYENRGRDVAPLLAQMQRVISDYEYFCHLHTKKTVSADYGDDWRRYLFKHLFGSEENITGIINLFEENPDLGIVFPETYPVLVRLTDWRGNYDGCSKLLQRLGIPIDLMDELVFPGGSMFWARTVAISDIFQAGFSLNDFSAENGELDDTLAHYIERLWVYAAINKGFSYMKVLNNCIPYTEITKKKRIIFFVHYDPENKLCSHDIKLVKSLSEHSSYFVLISNSLLTSVEKMKLEPYVSEIILRENKGYDFGAWRDALIRFGFDGLNEYDQVILVNNSVYEPIYDLSRVFAEMDRKLIDFWGIMLNPEIYNEAHLEKTIAAEYIQPYFMAFEKQVISNDDFKAFWMNAEDAELQKEVIVGYEIELTQLLSNAGFKYDVYIPETRYIAKYLNDYSFPYTNPYGLLVLGSPFIKKKCEHYTGLDERLKIGYLLSQLNLQ
jgi:lipopolysaccharide biosynthesis protein